MSLQEWQNPAEKGRSMWRKWVGDGSGGIDCVFVCVCMCARKCANRTTIRILTHSDNSDVMNNTLSVIDQLLNKRVR